MKSTWCGVLNKYTDSVGSSDMNLALKWKEGLDDTKFEILITLSGTGFRSFL